MSCLISDNYRSILALATVLAQIVLSGRSEVVGRLTAMNTYNERTCACNTARVHSDLHPKSLGGFTRKRYNG